MTTIDTDRLFAHDRVWIDPLPARSLEKDHLVTILRALIRERFPELKRPGQSVYVVCCVGPHVIDYPKRASSTVYIGEGKARDRLHTHAGKWIADLLRDLPECGIEIAVLEPALPNNAEFYRFVEGDLLAMFRERFGCLPLCNSQSEKVTALRYDYTHEAMKHLRALLDVGRGNKPTWSVRPRRGNQFYSDYHTGHDDDD